MSIDTERDGDILTIIFNRPAARNALDVEAMRQLNEALRWFRDDSSLVVAILTGAGEKAFCAGADLKRTSPPGEPFAKAYLAPYEESIETGMYVRAITLSELMINKPLIAAVNGSAVGGGLEIALDCDIRISAPHATFAFPEPRWASVTAVGGASKLIRAIGRSSAMKMLLTGDPIDADEAHRIGLVSDLVEADRLMEAALDIAQRIASNGPLAVQSIKTLMLRSDEVPLSQSIVLEQLHWGLLRDTQDRLEGRKAFSERRTPRYRGA